VYRHEERRPALDRILHLDHGLVGTSGKCEDDQSHYVYIWHK
jgi:hypothetical protein